MRTSVELFGDNGPNGKRAEIDEAPAINQGFGPKNRAVGFKEPFTSRSANRLPYALALNDDELDARLKTFEAGGLDTVYRGGSSHIAGIGRVINTDGGAVELRSKVGSEVTKDPANATLRLELESTADGAVGLDAVSRYVGESGIGVSLLGILDRRVIVINHAHTNLAASVATKLNPAGSNTYQAVVQGSTYYLTDVSGNTLLSSTDFVEVLNGDYKGLYAMSVVGRTELRLTTLTGADPGFAPNIDVLVRFWRPTFSSGPKGVRVSGSPIASTEPALALRPHQQAYALRAYTNGLGKASGGATIGPVGNFGAGYQRATTDDAFASPGFYYTPRAEAAAGATQPVGFVAHDRFFNTLKPMVGLAALARATASVPATFATTAFRIAQSDDSNRFFGARPGQLLQATTVPTGDDETTGVYIGTYVITAVSDVASGSFTVTVTDLGGNAPGLAGSGACRVHLLEGFVAGRRVINQPNPGVASHIPPTTSKVAATIFMGPDNDNTRHNTGLQITSQRDRSVAGTIPHLLLRGTNKSLRDVFAVTDEGMIYAKGIICEQPINGVGSDGSFDHIVVARYGTFGEYVTIQQTLGVGQSLTVGGGASVGANLGVGGNLTVNGTETIGGACTVNGKLTVNSSDGLQVNGPINCTGGLYANGNISGAGLYGQQVVVSGNGSFGVNLYAGQDLYVGPANARIRGADGAFITPGGLTVGQTATFGGSIYCENGAIRVKGVVSTDDIALNNHDILNARDFYFRNATLSGSQTIAGGLQVNEDIRVGELVDFLSPKTESKLLSLHGGQINSANWGRGPNGQYTPNIFFDFINPNLAPGWLTKGGAVTNLSGAAITPNGWVDFPLDLPSGAVITDMKVGIVGTIGHTMQAYLLRWPIDLINNAQSSVQYMRAIGGSTSNTYLMGGSSTPAFSVKTVAAISGQSQQIDRTIGEYSIRVALNHSGTNVTTQCGVTFIWVQWTMPGYRQG